jgi:rubrerythrin
MAEFANPFPGITQTRPITRDDLIRVLRLDLAAEQEAAFLYSAHADACDDKVVEKVLRDIASEEIVHAGELLTLIQMLSEDEKPLLERGVVEVRTLAREVTKIMGS